MRDYLNIGSTPYDEPCVQVGSPHYHKWGRKECSAFATQCSSLLSSEFGDDTVVSCSVKSFLHDFGTYHEVVVWYNPDNEDSTNQAFWLEENCPANWDQEALDILGPEYKDIPKC